MNLIDKVFFYHTLTFSRKISHLLLIFYLTTLILLTSSSLVLEKDWLQKSTEKINPNTSVNFNHNDYFVILYVKRTSERFMQFFKNIPNIKLSFFSINKLNSIIKVQKDPLPLLSHSNVVYKLRCAQCDASYVGQTRRLKTRIDEHRSHTRRNINQSSVITEYRLEFLHDFDWDNIDILDEEIYFNKRIISEMI